LGRASRRQSTTVCGNLGQSERFGIDNLQAKFSEFRQSLDASDSLVTRGESRSACDRLRVRISGVEQVGQPVFRHVSGYVPTSDFLSAAVASRCEFSSHRPRPDATKLDSFVGSGRGRCELGVSVNSDHHGGCAADYTRIYLGSGVTHGRDGSRRYGTKHRSLVTAARRYRSISPVCSAY